MALAQIQDFMGTDVYPDQGFRGFENLSRLQSEQALSLGDRAALYADPWREERKKYIPMLEQLVKSPGSIESSPFFKYAMDTAMNAAQRQNAARGLIRSGTGLAALQDRAAGVAGSFYPMIFDQYARLSGLNASSPGGAGLAFARSGERSQDYAQLSQSARQLGRYQTPQIADMRSPAQKLMDQLPLPRSQSSGWSSGAWPGAAMPYGSVPYGGGAGYGDYGIPHGGGAYPSSESGGGYMLSDYGATSFSPRGNIYEPYGSSFDPGGYDDYGWDWTGFNPEAYAEQDYWGYE